MYITWELRCQERNSFGVMRQLRICWRMHGRFDITCILMGHFNIAMGARGCQEGCGIGIVWSVRPKQWSKSLDLTCTSQLWIVQVQSPLGCKARWCVFFAFYTLFVLRCEMLGSGINRVRIEAGEIHNNRPLNGVKVVKPVEHRGNRF